MPRDHQGGDQCGHDRDGPGENSYNSARVTCAYRTSSILSDVEGNIDLPPMHSATPDSYHKLGHLIRGCVVTALLAAVARLGVADLLANGPLSAIELAQRCQAHPDALDRALRALVSVGVFTLDGDRFQLNDLAAPLRKDAQPSLRLTAMTAADPAFWQSYGAALHTIRTGQTAFEHVFGTDLFNYYRSHPAEADTFTQCMTEGSQYRLAGILSALDLGTSRRVVDVGGGEGTLIAGVLRHHPQVIGVLFDQPRVLTKASTVLNAAGVGQRCELAAGDFFRDDVPARGDLYLMKRIIHDWDDTRAAHILRNVHLNAPTGARLVLIEQLLRPDDPPNYLYDISMMLALGGRERTLDQYEALLADTGFALHSVTPAAVGSSLIEARTLPTCPRSADAPPRP